jgi:hypothetical protein
MADEKKREVRFMSIPTIEITAAEVEYIYIRINFNELFRLVHAGVEVHLKLNNL